jgi:hypothetical protein
MSLPFLNTAPARTSATRRGALTARHRVFLGMGVDVGRHLRLQGDREHLPRSLAHDLIEHRTARLAGLGLVVDYLEHGRTFATGAPTPAHDQTCYGRSIFLGKERPFTSPCRGPSTGSDHCSLPLRGSGCSSGPLRQPAWRLSYDLPNRTHLTSVSQRVFPRARHGGNRAGTTAGPS